MNTHQAETLTHLVADRAGKGPGPGTKMTFVELHDRSVDPETGYQPSPNLLWKVASGQDVKVSPQLVRAIAVGISLPLARVQAAAAFQYTGFVVAELRGAAVVREPGVQPESMPLAQGVLDRWEEEERGSDDNAGGQSS